MSGETTQGCRLPDDASVADLRSGDYLLRAARREMWMCLPNGAVAHIYVNEGAADGARVWGFTEHEDESITVTPSLDLHAADPSHAWHGWLERGVWRSC